MDEDNIYEFDLKSFFPSVDLRANEEILVKKLGIPTGVAEYIRLINQSVTKLQQEDLLDESNDRRVLLTSEGEPSPNLPKEMRERIEGLLSKLSSEKKE